MVPSMSLFSHRLCLRRSECRAVANAPNVPKPIFLCCVRLPSSRSVDGFTTVASLADYLHRAGSLEMPALEIGRSLEPSTRKSKGCGTRHAACQLRACRSWLLSAVCLQASRPGIRQQTQRQRDGQGAQCCSRSPLSGPHRRTHDGGNLPLGISSEICQLNDLALGRRQLGDRTRESPFLISMEHLVEDAYSAGRLHADRSTIVWPGRIRPQSVDGTVARDCADPRLG